MTPAESERLAAVEEQLAALSRELRATRASVAFLRALLAEDDPEAARAEEDAERILKTISGPGKPAADRPALQVLEGAPDADADAAGVRAAAAADQTPGWAAHSDRVAGRARRMPRRDRHGLHSL